MAIQTVGTQKFTLVNPDDKLAAAATKGVPFQLSEENNPQQGFEGAGTNEDDRMGGDKEQNEKGENKNSAPTVSGSPNACAASRSGASLNREHHASGGVVEGAGLTVRSGCGDNKRSTQKVSESPNARAVPRSGVSTNREARSRTSATWRKSTDHLSASEHKKAEEVLSPPRINYRVLDDAGIKE